MEEAPEMASLFMVGAAFPEGPQLPQASWSWARFRWCQGRQRRRGWCDWQVTSSPPPSFQLRWDRWAFPKAGEQGRLLSGEGSQMGKGASSSWKMPCGDLVGENGSF